MHRASECGFLEVGHFRPQAFHDARGFFTEFYRKDAFADLGNFVQDNHSYSQKGTIRGMHFQEDPGQAKLIYPIVGRIYDVFVDIRKDSLTFGKWEVIELDASKHDQVFIPTGFAHGFAVLSEEAHVIYKVSSYYDKEKERVFSYADPDVGIHWPIENPILSAKDASAPLLKEVL